MIHEICLRNIVYWSYNVSVVIVKTLVMIMMLILKDLSDEVTIALIRMLLAPCKDPSFLLCMRFSLNYCKTSSHIVSIDEMDMTILCFSLDLVLDELSSRKLWRTPACHLRFLPKNNRVALQIGS